jgi:2-oxoglutarate ferredoxin oxidoreductase subunit gamma
MNRMEFTIAGVGGQGSILAGVILGTAAVSHDRIYAVQTQAYSSELRGGFACAWVIVSDHPVDFPRVTNPDVLVAQAQDSIDRFSNSLKPGGILIADSDLAQRVPQKLGRVIWVPATTLSRSQFKIPVVANMIMLGALWQVTNVVSRPSLEAAIVESVPTGKGDMNLEAFACGAECADKQECKERVN